MDPQTLGADEQSWSRVVALYGRVEQQLGKAVQRAHGLGLSEYRALTLLTAAGPDGMRIQELAEAVGLNQSSVSRLADRLEDAGLIERCVCDSDRRGVYMYLTESGQDRQAAARPTYKQTLADALDAACEEEPLAGAARALRGADVNGLAHAR